MRTRVSYAGRVQGVGFRATAQWVASRFAVTGWVRNDPDGGVTLEAQGEAEAVREFLGEVGRAMAGNIRTAESSTMDEIPGESGFVVRR